MKMIWKTWLKAVPMRRRYPDDQVSPRRRKIQMAFCKRCWPSLARRMILSLLADDFRIVRPSRMTTMVKMMMLAMMMTPIGHSKPPILGILARKHLRDIIQTKIKIETSRGTAYLSEDS